MPVKPLSPADSPTLDITFEDEDLLILNKPSGLLSVPGKTEPFCLTSQAISYNANSRVVHRLDMSTSGLMIFAKNHASQKAMGHCFEQRKISKTYHAVIHSSPKILDGVIDRPLICDWPNRPKQKVCLEHGKAATTHYKTIRNLPHLNASFIHLTPVTGRSHQLRVHCLELGCAILGDQLYNTEGSNNRAPRLMLHAAELKFDHPITQQPIHVTQASGFNEIQLKP